MPTAVLLIGWKIPPLSTNQFRNNSPFDFSVVDVVDDVVIASLDGWNEDGADWTNDLKLLMEQQQKQQSVMNNAALTTTIIAAKNNRWLETTALLVVEELSLLAAVAVDFFLLAMIGSLLSILS